MWPGTFTARSHCRFQVICPFADKDVFSAAQIILVLYGLFGASFPNTTQVMWSSSNSQVSVRRTTFILHQRANPAPATCCIYCPFAEVAISCATRRNVVELLEPVARAVARSLGGSGTHVHLIGLLTFTCGLGGVDQKTVGCGFSLAVALLSIWNAISLSSSFPSDPFICLLAATSLRQ